MATPSGRSSARRKVTRVPGASALVAGSIAIWVFLAIVAGPRGFLSLGGTATARMPRSDATPKYVAVALLMIGGEFDLSAGVMAGSSGLLLGFLVTPHNDIHPYGYGLNSWVAIAIVLLVGLVVGFINGVLVMSTKLPSFIVTLATFFILQGINLGETLHVTGAVNFVRRDSLWQVLDVRIAGDKDAAGATNGSRPKGSSDK